MIEADEGPLAVGGALVVPAVVVVSMMLVVGLRVVFREVTFVTGATVLFASSSRSILISFSFMRAFFSGFNVVG